MSDFKTAIPGVENDKLLARLDIFEESVWLHTYRGGDSIKTSKPVDPLEITTKLLEKYPLATGLLPEQALWWRNAPGGAVTGIYYPPAVKQLTLVVSAIEKRFYQIPVPGLVFACVAGRAPYIWAVKRRPRNVDEVLYRAPFSNVFQYGGTCAGTQKYSSDVSEIPEMFFRSYFQPEADLRLRSVTFPDNVIELWDSLRGKDTFPLDELVADGRKLGEVIAKAGGEYDFRG